MPKKKIKLHLPKIDSDYLRDRLSLPAYEPEPHSVTERVFSNKRPKVSVIVVLWNNLELNKKCLASILQYSKDYELILVDNASTDETPGWLKQITAQWEKDTNLKIVTMDKNVGWPKGVNAGIYYAEGEHVLWMNNDIEVTAGWLEKLTQHLEFEATCGAVGPVTDFVMGFQKADLNPFFDRYGNHQTAQYLIGFCTLVKGAALKAVGGWIDESFWDVKAGSGSADDIDYSMRLKQQGFTMAIARDTFVKHHGSKSFEVVFGGDLYKPGSEAHKNYMADVDKYIARLREKWGEQAVKETLTLPPLPDQSEGTIGVPHGDFLPAETVHCLMEMQIPQNVGLVFNYGSGVAKARNNIVDCMSGKWLAFIDSDMTFPKDALVRLVEHLKNPEVDIVTAVAYRKVPNFEPCIFKKAEGNNPTYHHIGDWPKDRLFEIDACGSAFIVIRREVFKAMAKPWYRYSDFLSEDLNFCRTARDYGFRIWCDPSIQIGHVKGFPFGEMVYRNNPSNAKMIESAPQQWPELWNDGIKKAPSENAKELLKLAARAKVEVIGDAKNK